ncbi:covalently-linked cell wall protein [Apiospora phragmitis]|uniref:Covalently-linked cell wall protein n=1 Tax=Apiospora phragmitis TaxID=2905665 RepID=A0ABR1VCV2_9PEZI
MVATSTLLGLALAVPQGITEKLTPTGSAPAGCTGTMDGSFEITVAKITEKKRSVMPERRAECGKGGVLVMSLKDGTAKDSQDRIGYIASNNQFQFDKPAQAGALLTSGFSVCENNVLALGDSKTFYRCLSGTFYNLYNKNWAEQCEPVSIIALPCGSKDTAPELPDGQIVGTTVVQTTIVTALSDGQPQVITTKVPIPMCQIGDGQVQVHTTPCASVTSAPTTKATPTAPVSQISDGQIQVPPPNTAAPPPPAAPTTGTAPAGPAPRQRLRTLPLLPLQPRQPLQALRPRLAATLRSPAGTPSAPPASGSSKMAAGSIGALIVGMVAAIVSL